MGKCVFCGKELIGKIEILECENSMLRKSIKK